MWRSIRRRYALYSWNRRARHKNRVPLYVRDVPGLLNRVEERGVPIAVLRWPEDVPRTPEEERRCRGDVDLLIDGAGLQTVIALAADQPGPVRCDLHTTTGHRGTTFGGLPHYPPALAQTLLVDRERFDSAFFVLRPASYFRTLAYHLVYHKGLETGIPSGCDLPTNAAPKRPYARRIAEIAQSAGETLETPITLLSLHEELKRREWNAPLDLLARWPKPTAWHRWLVERERNVLAASVERLPDLLVFFIREDAAERALTGTICRMLEEKFQLLATEPLSGRQVERVMRQVRGGDWLERRRSTLIRPKTAVICYDRNPNAAGLEEAARNTGRSSPNPYPFVTNANVFFKHEIRERLDHMVGGPHRLHALHGSDDGYEAQHMLQAIYGPDCALMNQQFAAKLSQSATETRPRRAA
jgi:hypothetical protein